MFKSKLFQNSLKCYLLLISLNFISLKTLGSSFIDVSSEAGITLCSQEQQGFGQGVAAADFDSDGYVDLFVATPDNSLDRLYKNLGNGHFKNIAAEVGFESKARSRSGLWFDFDNDSLVDLLITTDCFRDDCSKYSSLLNLYRQDKNGKFVNVTDSSGLKQPPFSREVHRSGATVADFNNDGFLDLVTGFWEGQLSIYLNQGDGSFKDISSEIDFGQEVKGYWQPVVLDFNGDGVLDIYVSVDFSENKLWIGENSDTNIPKFKEVGKISHCNNDMNDMGLAIGDFDDDGDPDIYSTNILREDKFNVLFRNDSTETESKCLEISESAGVREGGWGWGATFFDANNDSHLDLAETNGWHLNGWENNAKLFIQDPNIKGTFIEKSESYGLTEDHWGSSLLAIDYDRDGDLDLIESISSSCSRRGGPDYPISIYKNQLENSSVKKNYILIRPRINGRNSLAIGAKVQIEIDNRILTRWITAGTSFLGQEPSEAFFGIKDIEIIDKVIVTWPDGNTTIKNNINANQYLVISYTPKIFENSFE